MTAIPQEASIERAVASTWSLRTSFGLVVAAQVLLFAGSNLPTPLFPIYEHRYGFGSGLVTLLFSSYVAVLIPALVVLGPLADRIGRRPLLVGGIALTVVSSAAFVAASGVAWLFAGEIIYGLASAMVMSSVSIAIRELHPTGHLGAASLAASVAMAAGMVLGPVIGGGLAELSPWPTTAPFVLDIVLASVLAFALMRIPETLPTRGTAPEGREARIPADVRRRLAGPAGTGAATFMVIGWVFGLSPSFFHEELDVHITRPLVAGLFAAMVAFTTGAAQLALRRQIGRRSTTAGLCALVIGMALIAASSSVESLPVAIVGGVVAAVGAGVAQLNAMAAVQQIAPDDARTSVMSAYATLCYLAISVPVVIAGLAADRLGLAAVTTSYAIALAAVVAIALKVSRPRPITTDERGGPHVATRG